MMEHLTLFTKTPCHMEEREEVRGVKGMRREGQWETGEREEEREGGGQNSWLSFCCHKTVEMRRERGERR